jgi:hypothetical protein
MIYGKVFEFINRVQRLSQKCEIAIDCIYTWVHLMIKSIIISMFAGIYGRSTDKKGMLFAVEWRHIGWLANSVLLLTHNTSPMVISSFMLSITSKIAHRQ